MPGELPRIKVNEARKRVSKCNIHVYEFFGWGGGVVLHMKTHVLDQNGDLNVDGSLKP